ncbi:Fc.00g110870.m01.CDS01 [Cosmosporella sp. VM-42]
MDEPMTDGTLEESPQTLDKMDLIKTVRGLDQNGPGKSGENLDTLWKCLTASADGQFHAAEESTLRWLLKSMNGSAKEAETMRRWPLTWTILECVFQRIPLFSLAKSLADRRFMAVLQQTLKDISLPTSDASSTSSSKRKRSTTISYALEDLKNQEGCLMTGDTLLHALKRLLGRLEATATQSSHDRIGAEHIRSLFCTSATEAASLASMSLMVCDLALQSDGSDQSEGRETWIETISTTWNLHLQGVDDTIEVSTQLFGPSSSMLSKLEGIPRSHNVSIQENLRAKWTTDIQKFLHRNLIFPSRAVYLSRQQLEPVEKALQVTAADIEVSAPALYFLASGATELLTDGRLRKGNVEWMKQVFKVVEGSLRERKNRDALLQVILERAAKLSMPIDSDDLRTICREYALHEDSTNWRLVADIAACDPDVFQLSEEGANLLKEVCERSTVSGLEESESEAVSRTLEAIVQGFRTGRDFSGFLKLWFEQLCKVEKQKSKTASPWLKVGVNQYGDDSFSTLIEKELSPQQLLDVLAWIESQKSHPRALCLFLNNIAQGVQSEAYAGAVGRRLFDLLSQVSKTSSNLTAFKWGVVSKSLSWVASQERGEIWGAVKKPLSKILTDAPIKSSETFEAFKCCCQAWVSMSPDDDIIEEPVEVVEAFTTRLASELITSTSLADLTLSSRLQLDAEPEFLEEVAFENYLGWFLRGSSRLNRLFSQKKGAIPQVLQNALAAPKGEIREVRAIWGTLLANENNVNDVKVIGDLIDRLINSLEADGKEKRWPEESSRTWIQSLSAVPTDAFTRPQRERIMALMNKHRVKTTKRISIEGWKMILGLSTKLMSRSTFYEAAGFNDNVDVADAMSDLSSSTPTNDNTLSDLIEAFFVMASTTIRQMAEHIEERSLKYFEESRSFVLDCDNAGDLSPFRLTLLKALVVETTRSPNCRSHADLASLPQSAKDILGKCVMSATGYFLTERKAFESHNVVADLRLLAAVHAAEALDDLTEASKLKRSEARKAEKRSYTAMLAGDQRGWKIQTFLRTYFSSFLEETRPTTFPSLESLPLKLRVPLLDSYVVSVTRDMGTAAKMEYLKDLIETFTHGSDADGQVLAIQNVVNQLIECSDLENKGEEFDLATAHSELAFGLASAKTTLVSTYICRTIQALLEKKPQSMTQWNVELTLNTVCGLASPEAEQTPVPFAWLCKLVEVIIKKHRLRLEGHHHLLLTTMQTLLRNLVFRQAPSDSKDQAVQESKAHLYARLITLICEPTAGAVSRSQHQSSLDSATDAAKRSAGRHMYLVLMQYVKLQLEADVPRPMREALEPALNSVFDITPPEVRKILNDAMDGSGRAILREMYKRYTKFGKWSGV